MSTVKTLKNIFSISTLLAFQVATAAEQQSTASSAVEKAPIISFSMIKAAFKFGFQSGWMIKK